MAPPQTAAAAGHRRRPPHAPAEQVWTQAPAGLGLLVAYWTGLYLATAFQESKLHVE